MRNMPILVINIYILLTLFISFFGPMKYVNYNKLSVALYIFSFLICLNTGFFLRHKIKIVVKKTIISTPVDTDARLRKIIKLINLSILIGLFSVSIEFIDSIIKNPSLLSFQNMGSNYIKMKKEYAGVNDYSFALLLRFFSGFFRFVILILAPYYFRQLNKKYKLLYLTYMALLLIVNGIVYGTQQVLGYVIIFLVIIGVIKMLDMNIPKRIKILKNSAMLVVVIIILFSFMQVQRYDAIGINAANFTQNSSGDSYYDMNNIVFKIFGDKLGFGISSILSGYLSGGYYGLSLALQLPFVWTYGFGSSYILSQILSRLLNMDNLYNLTYLNRMKLEFGRDGLVSWNTIFPWLASDLTFIGALILFIPIGYILGLTWYEILKYRNPVSIMLFSTIFLGLIFVPANNQLFHGIDTTITTTCIIIYWVFNHKKYNFDLKK